MSAVMAFVAAACLLSATGCTPPANGVNGPTPSPTASVTTKPPETAQQRLMRLDQEAAVKAYRAALAEDDRVSSGGGAFGATPQLSAVATGKYLDFVVGFWRQAKELGLRSVGSGSIVYVAAGGWSPTEIHLKACEDASSVRIVDSKGRNRTPTGARRYVQDYTVAKTKNRWKVADVDSTPVETFESYGCSR